MQWLPGVRRPRSMKLGARPDGQREGRSRGTCRFVGIEPVGSLRPPVLEATPGARSGSCCGVVLRGLPRGSLLSRLERERAHWHGAMGKKGFSGLLTSCSVPGACLGLEGASGGRPKWVMPLGTRCRWWRLCFGGEPFPSLGSLGEGLWCRLVTQGWSLSGSGRGLCLSLSADVRCSACPFPPPTPCAVDACCA